MYPYIDDIFHAQASANQSARTRDISLRCHFKLGFIINLKKSALVPSQVMLDLGALIDTARGLVFPSPARTETIIHATRALLDLTQVSALRLRQVTGLLASCHALFPLCMFRLRPLSTLLRDHFDMRVDGTSKLIPLSSPVILSTLEFWSCRDLVSQGIPLQPLPPSHVLTTDTSTYGWGAVCGPLTARVCVVEGSVFSPYKLSRAGDCFPRLEDIPEVAVWHIRPSSDGQHYGDALSEQGGRDQVQELGLEGQGDYSLVSEHEDHIVSSTYLRTGQCGGGSPLSVSDRESSPPGALHRMVFRPQGDQPTLRYLGPTYSRLVRHSAEQQGRGILCSPPRPSSSAGQLSASGLVQGSTVHVSPGAPPIPCSSQGDQGGGSGHSHSSMVAAKRVVSPGPAAPSGPASDVARV